MSNQPIVDNFKRGDAELSGLITGNPDGYELAAGRQGEFFYPIILFFNDESLSDASHVHTDSMTGEVIIEVTETGLEWVGFPSSTITLGDADGYPRPNSMGNNHAYRVDLTGIVDANGATHFKLIVGCNKRA